MVKNLENLKGVKVMKYKILVTAAVLAVGMVVAYQSLQPQELKRDISDELEIVPLKELKFLFVAPQADKLIKSIKSLDAYKVAENNGLKEDVYEYLAYRADIKGWPLKIAELLSGDLSESLVGSEFIYAKYSEGRFLIITKPRASVRMSWRAVLSKGTEREAFGYKYVVLGNGLSLSFVGHLFIASNSQELMDSAFARLATLPETKVSDYLEHVRRDSSDAFGLALNSEDKLFAFKKMEFFADGKLHIFIEQPGGFLGASIAEAQEPNDLKVRDGACIGVSLDRFKPVKGDKWLRKRFPKFRKLSDEFSIREGLKAFKGHMEFYLYGFRPSYTMQPIFVFTAEIDQKKRFGLRKLTDWFFDPEGFIDWRIHEDIFGVWNLPTDKALPKELRPYWEAWAPTFQDLEQPPDELPFKIVGKVGDWNDFEEIDGFAFVDFDRLSEVMAGYAVEVAKHTDELSSKTAREKLAPVISKLRFGRFVGRFDRRGKTLIITFLRG